MRRPLREIEVRVARHVLRAFEHHVFEQMREPGPARHFVRRTDVIPEVHGDQRKPVIFGQDHVQPVRQRVLFEFQLRNFERRWFGAAGLAAGFVAGFRGVVCAWHRLRRAQPLRGAASHTKYPGENTS